MRIFSDGLCIFFATQDNQNKPAWKPEFDKMYGVQGFYANIKLDGIPSPWPDEINCILGKFYYHFIWISKKICESEDIQFAWVFSHELQHLNQSLKNPFLLILAELFDYVKHDITDFHIPTELECEGTAKQIVISIFGKEKCISYLRKMKAGSSENNIRYSKLLGLNIMEDFNVEKEMQKAICINKKNIKKIQELMEKNNRTNWNIDIDKICSCKDPHEAIVSAVKRRA